MLNPSDHQEALAWHDVMTPARIGCNERTSPVVKAMQSIETRFLSHKIVAFQYYIPSRWKTLVNHHSESIRLWTGSVDRVWSGAILVLCIHLAVWWVVLRCLGVLITFECSFRSTRYVRSILLSWATARKWWQRNVAQQDDVRQAWVVLALADGRTNFLN